MQGQSDYTRFKRYRFAPILAQSLHISNAQSVRRFAYYHVDLHAGCGFNHRANVDGSPLNFLIQATRIRPNFYAFFADHDEPSIRTLVARPELEEHASRIAVFLSDNSKVLPVVSAFVAARERRPEFAVGSVLIDPNGYHKGVPWDALAEFCAAHPRFDVLMNLSTRSFRMERTHIQRGDGAWARYTLRPIESFPDLFSRANWMLTQETRFCGHSWVQLVGRSMTTQEAGYRSLGYFAMQSDRGVAILAGLEQQLDDDAETSADESSVLPDVPGVPTTPSVPGRASRRDGSRPLPLFAV